MQTIWETTDDWKSDPEIKHLECYEATIRYLDKDIKIEALPDGYRGIFQAGWLIDEEDSIRFRGQWAMLPAEGLLWVPSSELIDIVPVSSNQYYDEHMRYLRSLSCLDSSIY